LRDWRNRQVLRAHIFLDEFYLWEVYMDYTDEKIAEVKKDFSQRRKRAVMFTLALIPLVFLFAFGSRGGASFLGLPSGAWIIIFFIVLVPSYINWRCPNCKSFLGRGSGFSPGHCRNCGIPLAGD
jgi:hypothetical protein